MSSQLYRMGRFAARRPFVVIGAWVAVFLIVMAATTSFGKELEDSMEVPGLDSQHAIDLLAAAQSDSAGLTAQVVATPVDGSATFGSASEAAALSDLRSNLIALSGVVGASEPVVSPDGDVALIWLQYRVVEESGPADLEALKTFAEEANVGSLLQVEMGGELFFTFEEAPTGMGEMLGLVAAGVILLVAFGSIIAMGLPIGMALFGLALGVTSMGLITYVIDIPSWAPQMAAMIGLGVGIDYALFILTRHREYLAEGLGIDESAGRALATAGQSVVFAGGTVMISVLGLAIAGLPFMTAAAVATSVVVGVMILSSLTLLPAFLGLAGHRLDGRRIGRRSHRNSAAVGERWRRWGEHVTKNAWVYAIGVTAVLIALTAPVLSLRLGFPDEGTYPESRTERRAYDLVAEGFGPGINGPLLIAVDISDDATVVEPLAVAIAKDSGVAGVTPPTVDTGAGVATIIAYPTTAPQDDATVATIDRLRADVFPVVLAQSEATAHIGGATASVADMGAQVSARLPWFIAAVVGLSFLLLVVLFRSILVPLKAAILNLLSIGAAYGVLVAVFQWGWGMDLIGLEATIPVISFLPLFMFAVLFGLSMDYEVFLLSRIREEYVATGDNDESVIRGIASTARVITSAALIMVAVFLGFALGDDPTIKMMGVGLATAIFVDATVVRMILVPATMKLLGDANWWLPAWLDRLLPTIDIDGQDPEADDHDRELVLV